MLARARRDYYTVLGVSRDADREAIKKAFRALATEHHPDVSGSPEADERFREIREAYEVLSRPESRARYDRFGQRAERRPNHTAASPAGGLFDDLVWQAATTPRPGQRGLDVAVTAEVGFVEAAKGTTLPVRYMAVAHCLECGGTGAGPGGARHLCSACEGAGRQRESVRDADRRFRYRPCVRCGGAGYVVSEPCGACEGQGRVEEERTRLLVVAPGTKDTARLRFAGEGHAGGRGAEPGDLVVRLRVAGPPDAPVLRHLALGGVAFGIGLVVLVLVLL
jgi:molecular chaperone DnaJ